MILRYLRYLILAVIAVVLLTVALANRDLVVIKLLPAKMAAFSGYDVQFQLPLYLVMFGGIAAGLLIGFVWEWLREHKIRATASSQKREVTRLERELAVMRDTKSMPKDDVLALLEQRKAG